MMNRLLLAFAVALLLGGCTPRGSTPRGDDDDDDSAGDDDDATADDDDSTAADDDDATADDDDSTAGDDDDSTAGDDDDSTGDDDDSTAGDDDDSTAGDDDDSTAAPLALGDLIITEVLTNPDAVDDTAGEWFEVLNLTSGPIDLSGWLLSDRDTDSLVLSPSSALIVNGGDYVVLGRSDVPGENGGAPVDWAYGTGFTMANSEDEIVLTAPSGLEIYAMEYTSSFPNPAGVATQLSGAALTYPASLDLLTNWCGANGAGAGTFGMGDTGTPGQTNPACP